MMRQPLPTDEDLSAGAPELLTRRNIRRSRHQRKAVRVLPVPVGARMRVESPRAMAGQPSRCGAVISAKVERNHAAVMGWKRLSASSLCADGEGLELGFALGFLAGGWGGRFRGYAPGCRWLDA